MKRYIDGHEVAVSDDGIRILEGADRLYVQSEEGVFTAVAVRQGDRTLVSYRGRQCVVERKPHRIRASSFASSGELRAPMPGVIIEVFVSEGERVIKGAKLIALEAMKTQQTLTAPFDGTVQKLSASKGLQVTEGALLAVIEASAD